MVLGLVTVLAFGVVAASGRVDFADSDPPVAVPAVVSVSATQAPQPVPAGYFGLSTEYWTLPLYAAHIPVLERILALLHVPGDGPMVLRIGGDSADHVYWEAPVVHVPGWAVDLTPRWTALAGELVRRLGLRLILDLNLVTDIPATAARWAEAAERELPAHSIVGFEVGNEPDLYSHAFWDTMTSGGLLDGGHLPAEITAHAYARDFHAYATALATVAPHVPLLGPALAAPHSHWRWVSTLTASRPPGLRIITVHRYPLTACARDRATAVYPTVARVLSQQSSAGMAASLGPALAAAHHAGLPLRVTELNSVTCGGRPAVSNTFSTALWAPDALYSLLHRGVAGVNLHVRADAINAPFAFNPHGLVVRPLLYGLLMFVRSLGPRAQLIPLQLHAPPAARLAAWAIRTGGHLHLLLLDKGRHLDRVSLRLPGVGPASVERLLASSPYAQSGVTLDGQRLNAAGRWVGRAAHEFVSRRRDRYVVALSRYSAALVSASQPTGTPAP